MRWKTTFWMDFTIADAGGTAAIYDTFKRAMAEWSCNCEYLTELVIVLNLKIWQHYEEERLDLAKLYDSLWRTADEYALNNLQGEQLSYFLNTTN